jgi:phytepsin
MQEQESVDVQLKNYYNYNYVGTLYVGNPPQKVRAIFDSGSTNQWVLTSLCEGERICNGINMFYDPSKSSTYEPTETFCEIEFGSGSLQGFFAFDDVRVGASIQSGGLDVLDVIHV